MKRIFFLALLSIPVALAAQPFVDIASAYYQKSPADYQNESGKSRVNSSLTSVVLNFPLQVDSDYVIINPVYENLQIDYPGMNSSNQLTAVYMPLTWLHQWRNPKWKTAFVFIPRLSGDFTAPVFGNDFQAGGAVVMMYQKKQNLTWQFGAYYNSEFFGPFFIPLAGIDWRINNKWSLFGLLPNNITIEYKAGKIMHISAAMNFATNSYRSGTENFVRIDDNILKMIFDIYLSKNQVFSVEAGHSALRKYRSGFMAGNEPQYFDQHVTEGYIFKIAYVFRLRMDEK